MATVFNPLGAGIRWGATIPNTAEGDIVAVLGSGIRGMCASVAAKEAGASFVMMTGLGPRDLPRLELARRFGVDLAVDVAEQDPVAELARATDGELAHVVVDVTAKAPTAFAQAVALSRIGGRVVVAGTRGGGGTPGFDPDHVVYKELTIVGSLGVDYPAYREAIDLLVADRWPFDELTREVVGFDRLPKLLETLSGGNQSAVPPLHGVFVPGADAD
jgi:alcohol dehydrogenase